MSDRTRWDERTGTMLKTFKLSLQKFVNMMFTRKGTTLMVIETVTIPKQVKNPYGKIFKHSRVKIQTGFDWENAVNNALAKQGEARDFVAGERQWGETEEKRMFSFLRDKVYLRARKLHVYHDRYFVNGKEVNYDVIAPYLRVRNDPQPAEFRNYSLENIKAVVLKRRRWVLQPSPVVLP